MAKKIGKAATKKVSFRNNPVKVRYYGLNCIKSGMPKATIAVGVKNDIIARGIALCSHSEMKDSMGYVEGVGKDIAKRRVLRAFNRGKDTQPVLREEAMSVINSVRYPAGLEQGEVFFMFKSAFDVIPTKREAKLLGV